MHNIDIGITDYDKDILDLTKVVVYIFSTDDVTKVAYIGKIELVNNGLYRVIWNDGSESMHFTRNRFFAHGYIGLDETEIMWPILAIIKDPKDELVLKLKYGEQYPF